MKENESIGAIFIGIMCLVICLLVGGIANTKGYDRGYEDAKNGKERWDVPKYNPYPNTYGGYEENVTIPTLEDDDYLISDKKNKGGNEYDKQIGEEYKGFGEQDYKDGSKARIDL